MNTITEKNLLHLLPPTIHSWPHASFENTGITVDVLRLDLMHPVIGGNKWMKLKGFLAQAMAGGNAGILTKGGPWSNHIHACAWLCRALGLNCHIWVKGSTSMNTAMLEDVADWGGEIRFVNRLEFNIEQNTMEFATENNLLYIPMGGAEEMGIQEVSQFMQQLHLPFYPYAICAVGTATTFGGTAFAPQNFKNILGIDAGTRDDSIKQKITQWQQLMPEKKLSLITNYDFGGFARYTPALTSFMNDLFATHQIPTDIVYTGKLFYAVLKLAEKNYFQVGAKVLVIHSGGLQGNRSLPVGTLEF